MNRENNGFSQLKLKLTTQGSIVPNMKKILCLYFQIGLSKVDMDAKIEGPRLVITWVRPYRHNGGTT